MSTTERTRCTAALARAVDTGAGDSLAGVDEWSEEDDRVIREAIENNPDNKSEDELVTALMGDDSLLRRPFRSNLKPTNIKERIAQLKSE